MNAEEPYSQEDYKLAKHYGFDLDNWINYVEYFELGEKEEYDSN